MGLKAHKILGLNEQCASVEADYYLKSEADEVIAEKDETIDELKEHVDELQKATDSAWSKVNTMYDEIRHHKYKRCLAMAKWCKTSARYDESLGAFGYRNWYWKWFNRWLELAEKFKEMK